MVRTIYGFDDLERKVPVGSYDDGLEYVGGKIFYIDSTSTATYKFYDANINEISNVAVGDAPMYSKKLTEGNNKDKYYVYYNEIPTSDKNWGNQNVLVGTSESIGSGKVNTSAIINNGGVFDPTSQIDIGNNIWIWLINFNNTSTTCKDWYMASKDETSELKNFLDQYADGQTIINYFSSNYIWSSSEYDIVTAWTFRPNPVSYDKGFANCRITPVRSF